MDRQMKANLCSLLQEMGTEAGRIRRDLLPRIGEGKTLETISITLGMVQASLETMRRLLVPGPPANEECSRQVVINVTGSMAGGGGSKDVAPPPTQARGYEAGPVLVHHDPFQEDWTESEESPEGADAGPSYVESRYLRDGAPLLNEGPAGDEGPMGTRERSGQRLQEGPNVGIHESPGQ